MKIGFLNWKRCVRRSIALGLHAIVVFGLTDAAAEAQTTNSALNEFLAGIRSDGGAVEIGSAESGKNPGDLRLADVRINFQQDKNGQGVSVGFGKLELAGLRLEETKLVIERARGERARFAGEAGQLSLATFSVDKLTAPRFTAAKTEERPFRSLIESLAQGARTEFKQISADDVRWERPLNASAAISIAHFAAFDAKNGTIGRAVFTQAKRIEEGNDRTAGVETISVNGLDLAQLIKIFSSQDQKSGEAREWWSLASAISLDGYVQTDKLARTEIAQIQLSGLRVRRLAVDAVSLFDLAATRTSYFSEHPDQARKLGEALMDAVKLDRAKVTGLTGTDGQSPVARRFRVEAIELTDLDPLNAEAITITAIEDHRGDSGASIGRVALSKLRLIDTGVTSPDGAPARKLPVFGGVAIEDVKFVQPGALIEMKAFNWDAPTYRGVIPTKFQATVAGLTIPAGMMPDPGIRAGLVTVGVTSLPIDVDVSAGFDSVREQLNLDHLGLSVGALGQIEVSGAMVGLPASALDSMDGFKAAALTSSLKGVKLKYVDAGLAGYIINAIAAANKQPADQIRKALTANMPVLLGSVPDASARNTLIFAFVGFLNDPQGIEFSSLAQSPVPVAELDKALREAPATIPVLLKLNATATRKR